MSRLRSMRAFSSTGEKTGGERNGAKASRPLPGHVADCLSRLRAEAVEETPLAMRLLVVVDRSPVGPRLQHREPSHECLVERPAGPEVEVVDVLRGAPEAPVAGHDLLADHLVRIEAVEERRLELDATEVRLLLECEIARVEDRIEAVADLELEAPAAVLVLVLDRPAEVPFLLVAELRNREGDPVERSPLGKGAFDLRFEAVLVRRVQVDVLREPSRASADALAERGAALEEQCSRRGARLRPPDQTRLVQAPKRVVQDDLLIGDLVRDLLPDRVLPHDRERHHLPRHLLAKRVGIDVGNNLPAIEPRAPASEDAPLAKVERRLARSSNGMGSERARHGTAENLHRRGKPAQGDAAARAFLPELDHPLPVGYVERSVDDPCQ